MCHPQRSKEAHGQNAGGSEAHKKTPGGTATVSSAVAAYTAAHPQDQNARAAGNHLCQALGHVRCDQLTSWQLNDLVSVWKSTKRPATAHGFRHGLKRLVAQMEQRHGTPYGTASLIQKTKKSTLRAVSPTAKERAAMLELGSTHMRIAILLAGDHGLRAGSVLSFELKDYDRPRKQISFAAKGNDWQTLPASEELCSELDALPQWLPQEDPLLPLLLAAAHKTKPNASRKTSYALLHADWHGLKTAAGVNPELHIHDLRRGAAEGIYEATKDIRAAQQLLGHKHITTTAIYLGRQITATELRDKITEAVALKDKARQKE